VLTLLRRSYFYQQDPGPSAHKRRNKAIFIDDSEEDEAWPTMKRRKTLAIRDRGGPLRYTSISDDVFIDQCESGLSVQRKRESRPCNAKEEDHVFDFSDVEHFSDAS
jgi:hypothetical protein